MLLGHEGFGKVLLIAVTHGLDPPLPDVLKALSIDDDPPLVLMVRELEAVREDTEEVKVEFWLVVVIDLNKAQVDEISPSVSWRYDGAQEVWTHDSTSGWKLLQAQLPVRLRNVSIPDSNGELYGIIGRTCEVCEAAMAFRNRESDTDLLRSCVRVSLYNRRHMITYSADWKVPNAINGIIHSNRPAKLEKYKEQRLPKFEIHHPNLVCCGSRSASASFNITSKGGTLQPDGPGRAEFMERVSALHVTRLCLLRPQYLAQLEAGTAHPRCQNCRGRRLHSTLLPPQCASITFH